MMSFLQKLLFSFLVLLLGLNSYGKSDPKIIDQKIIGIGTYLQKAVSWRDKMHALYGDISGYYRSQNGKIKARDLESLHQQINYFEIQIRRPLDKLISKNQEHNLLDFKYIHFKITKNKKSKIIHSTRKVRVKSRRARGVRYKTVKGMIYRVNPNDKLGQRIYENLKLQLTSQLIALDNYALGLIPFMENADFRNLVLIQTPVGNIKNRREDLVDSWESYTNKLYKKDDLYKGIKIISKIEKIHGQSKNMNRYKKMLDRIYRAGPSFQYISENLLFHGLFRGTIGVMRQKALQEKDYIARAYRQIFFELSKAFGNTAGLIQWRDGKLLKMSLKEEKSITRKLRPLDILFEKTPFRLTDLFIPGHWGHSAIWTGTESELKKLGVWDKLPKLYRNAQQNYGYLGVSFQRSIKKGRKIIEALRPGVQINTFRNFLDVDDLAVVRMKSCSGNKQRKNKKGNITCLTRKHKQKYLLKLFEQVGKNYDFHFDVNTDNEIICSELPYRTFLDIDFNTDYTLGRHNISPDRVADLADDKGDIFTPTLIYFNGKRVKKKGPELRFIFKLLLDKKYEEIEINTGICADYHNKDCF